MAQSVHLIYEAVHCVDSKVREHSFVGTVLWVLPIPFTVLTVGWELSQIQVSMMCKSY